MAKPKSKITGLNAADAATINTLSKVDNSLAELDAFKSQLQKDYESVITGSDNYIRHFIPTNVEALDVLLGGGLPGGGCFTEIAGLPGSGKSSLALKVLSGVQKNNGLGLLIDTEYGTGDEQRLALFNVDPARLVISCEDLVEKAFDQVEKFCNFIVKRNLQEAQNIVIIDSIAGLTTAAEIESDIDAAQVAVVARMLKKCITRVKAPAREANIAILCNNQARVKLGTGSGLLNPPVYTTPGGSTLAFQAITRLLFEQGTMLGEKGFYEGHVVRSKILKCKTSGALGRTLPIQFYYDERTFDDCYTTYRVLNDAKLIETRGAWKYITINGHEFKWCGEPGFRDVHTEVKAADPNAWKNLLISAFKFTPVEKEEKVTSVLVESIDDSVIEG